MSNGTLICTSVMLKCCRITLLTNKEMPVEGQDRSQEALLIRSANRMTPLVSSEINKPTSCVKEFHMICTVAIEA